MLHLGYPNLCGNSLQPHATTFFEQAGPSTEYAFDLSIIMYCAGIIGTLLSWVFMKYYGQRILYLMGLSGMAIMLFIIGSLSTL